MARVTADRNPKQASHETEELRQSHKRLTRQILTHPMFSDGDVRELPNYDVQVGNNVFRHGLGRTAKRWLVVRCAGNVPDFTFVSADDSTLTLASSVTANIDLWVM